MNGVVDLGDLVDTLSDSLAVLADEVASLKQQVETVNLRLTQYCACSDSPGSTMQPSPMSELARGFQQKFHLVVIGAGPYGLETAAWAKSRGWLVTILEQQAVGF
jgi:cell division septum initiation protein DivIVA